MSDYTWPSIYFSYLFFAAMFGGAVYFCFKTYRAGYFGRKSEEAKFRMLEEE